MPGVTILRNGEKPTDPDNNVTVYEWHHSSRAPEFDVTVTKEGIVTTGVFVTGKVTEAIVWAGEEAVRHGFGSEIYIAEA
ncbi:hypothetical protein [Methylobacterium nodulans]|uniref:Uncharacterized protein n=1 Tax=Methylobacterium nodulans (strain LMG 21967 / CNCM I-2342 / ORS 2060) TaxID=460265 RepID=B8IXT7_METNO|nr:hypothetical protein [Methylobacterium nodulans]ACL63227.1 hypothetical protein Mnod_8766 [Methylobacterium nodulans ORS 2060]